MLLLSFVVLKDFLYFCAQHKRDLEIEQARTVVGFALF